jgi:hypothetical protein
MKGEGEKMRYAGSGHFQTRYQGGDLKRENLLVAGRALAHWAASPARFENPGLKENVSPIAAQALVGWSDFLNSSGKTQPAEEHVPTNAPGRADLARGLLLAWRGED